MPSDKVATSAAIGAFLRALAARAERDATFAQGVAEALAESGLQAPASGKRAPSKARGRPARSDPSTAAAHSAVLDPFALLRSGGEDGLRTALAAIEVAALHGLVRTHRLDPARISARWTARERLVELIVTQVRARARHGQAFARV
jgi:hypothetical protein